MMQVWLLFKCMETIGGTACMIYHAMGFLGKEPLPHNLLFCGTFFGFTLLSFMGAINIVVGGSPPAVIECIVNLCAAVMFIVASIVSMHYAEDDFHLMYLSDFEEPLHPYFAFSRAQSISALATGSLHLLHAIFAFDVLVNEPSDEDSDSDSESEQNMDSPEKTRPIHMYFLSKYIENRLRRNQWFDHLCQRRSGPLTLFSIIPLVPSRRHSNILGMADVEKRGSNDSKENTSTQPQTSKEHENMESLTSEEMRSSFKYNEFFGTGNFSGTEDGKGKSSTRFNIPENVSDTSIGPQTSPAQQELHSILRKDVKKDTPEDEEDKKGNIPQQPSPVELHPILGMEPKPENANEEERKSGPSSAQESTSPSPKPTEPEKEENKSRTILPASTSSKNISGLGSSKEFDQTTEKNKLSSLQPYMSSIEEIQTIIRQTKSTAENVSPEREITSFKYDNASTHSVLEQPVDSDVEHKKRHSSTQTLEDYPDKEEYGTDVNADLNESNNKEEESKNVKDGPDLKNLSTLSEMKDKPTAEHTTDQSKPEQENIPSIKEQSTHQILSKEPIPFSEASEEKPNTQLSEPTDKIDLNPSISQLALTTVPPLESAGSSKNVLSLPESQNATEPTKISNDSGQFGQLTSLSFVKAKSDENVQRPSESCPMRMTHQVQNVGTQTSFSESETDIFAITSFYTPTNSFVVREKDTNERKSDEPPPPPPT